MNLWRVRIDEATGHLLGEPEPITTPSLWSGEISFSRDGSRLAFSSLDWRSTLWKVAFDAKEEKIVGSPAPVLQSTQPIRDHQVSPDGEWVAGTVTGIQEDLFVARVDGSQYRRLTDDPFRDRGPSWTPDGQRIGFYSDRGGSYQVWTIRPDGSGLTRVTNISEGSVNYPVWSPDGGKLALAILPGNWQLVDVDSPARPSGNRAIPLMDSNLSFWPLSWSRDGARLAGVAFQPDGTAGEVTGYEIASGRYETLSEMKNPFFKYPIWLADGRRLMVRGQPGVFLLDSRTKKARLLIPVGGYFLGASVGLSRDNRQITYTETGTQGDIWIAELK